MRKTVAVCIGDIYEKHITFAFVSQRMEAGRNETKNAAGNNVDGGCRLFASSNSGACMFISAYSVSVDDVSPLSTLFVTVSLPSLSSALASSPLLTCLA